MPTPIFFRNGPFIDRTDVTFEVLPPTFQITDANGKNLYPGMWYQLVGWKKPEGSDKAQEAMYDWKKDG